MVVDFSKLDPKERPVLILKNTSGIPIGTLGYAMNVSLDIKYNETSTLEFTIPERLEGFTVPYYNAVIGMRIIDIEEIGQFILMNPKESSDGVKRTKACKGYSLEYEFTFKKITLPQSTYNFWNPASPESTLLGMILEEMPSWGVGAVDNSLIGKYRTFEVSDTNLYNFIKSTVQQSYNCVFDFDTRSRLINVRDASSHVLTNPIYISNANLAKEITVSEETENIVTRLDVNGADGVDIREVNPSGTNSLINLDYFMNTDNFDQALIDKYYAWKDLYDGYKTPYYNLSIEYSLLISGRTAESAALTEFENELGSLENQQAVTIQAIAQSLQEQSALDEINQKITTQQELIKEKKLRIESIQSEVDSIYNQLKEINTATKFDTYFTPEEYLLLDRYIRDDAVSESSFVAVATESFSGGSKGNDAAGETIAISSAEVALTRSSSQKDIFSIKGGTISSSNISAELISSVLERSEDGSFIMSAYLGVGEIDGSEFVNACLSVTGVLSDLSHDIEISENKTDIFHGTGLIASVLSGYLYFTYDTTEYQKRSVAWDLYEYGEEVLKKISQPSFTFSVTSANFLNLEDFISFKNSLRHGEKIYVGITEDKTLSPICIGVNLNFDSMEDLTLTFSDTYTSSDSSFLLADLLEQSVSMGKNVDLNKYTYSAFVDSGASTKVRDFMSTALDVSKNSIMSTKDQAITWGESGIRLRKWADDAHTVYDPKQVWMNNNSILMTSTNWSTAEIAIGNFNDPNLGDCWGIVAPNLVGTLLAGENLVIESKKKDGDVAVFKVDADGCVLHNSSFDIISRDNKTQIALDPQFGIVIGDYPVYTTATTRSSMLQKTVDTDKAKFWVDTDGNLVFKGTLKAATGEFDGKVTAREGYIGEGSVGWTIGSTQIYNGKPTLSSTTEGIYIGTDGISLGDGTHYVKALKSGALAANNAIITGDITATSGKIGGFTIDGDSITYNGLGWGEFGTGIYIGPNGLQLGSNFFVDSAGNLTATSGTFTGEVYAGSISYGGSKGTFNGAGLTNGSVTGGSGGKIGSGTITTGNTSNGINTSLGYADWSNSLFKGVEGYSADSIITKRLTATDSASLAKLSVGGHSVTTKSATIKDYNGDNVTIAYWGWA